MLNLSKILMDGGLFAILGGVYLMLLMRINPRLFLSKNDMPPDILAAVPPKTDDEKRLALILGIPFLVAIIAVPLVSALQFQQAETAASFLAVFVHAFAILMVFNLFDLIVLDGIIFCGITPRFVVVPGTEGMAGYKDYGFHLRQHARSVPFMALVALIIAIVVWLL
ncbi:MAG: nitroreductase [Anaerolineae bacterium]|nr:nitroreductase [Anaerolineae bacterium]